MKRGRRGTREEKRREKEGIQERKEQDRTEDKR